MKNLKKIKEKKSKNGWKEDLLALEQKVILNLKYILKKFDGKSGYVKNFEGQIRFFDIKDQKIVNNEYILDNIVDKFYFSFEMPLAMNCNLNCQMCTAFSPLVKHKALIDEKSLKKDLKRMQSLFKNKTLWIRFVGVEPLLNPNLLGYLKYARKLFKNSAISVTTNGILLTKKPKSFFDALEKLKIILIISPYPYKKVFESIDFLKNKKIFFFRTVNNFKSMKIPLDLSGLQNPIESFRRCMFECHLLKDGKLSRCFYPEMIFIFNEYFNVDLKVTKNDFIDIYNVSRDEIFKKIQQPLDFCKYCNNSKIDQFEWKKSNCSLEEWT